MDRKYEYVGLDIRDKVHNEVFKYIFSIGNHYIKRGVRHSLCATHPVLGGRCAATPVSTSR